MKRILPLILIAFLFSCNNQQSETTTTEVQEEKKPELNFSNKEVEERVTIQAEPDNSGAVTIKVGENEEDQDNATPKDREASFLFNKGTTAYSNGDFEKGVEYFEQIVLEQYNNKKAYYNLGLGYFELEKFADAIEAFTKAIDLDPKDPMPIQYRGRVYYMMGDFANCLKDYDKVVSLTPDDAVAYYNRGTARGRVVDYLGAIKDFDKAIEIKDDYAEAYFNRGLANHFQGRDHEACYDWRKAHSLGHYESEKAIRQYCEDNNQ